MVNVSKNKLSPDISKKIYGQLSELFLANTKKSQFSKTFYEILSPTERLMLSKRVGIIGMLVSDYSSREISIALKVSTSTVSNLSEQMHKGKFKHVVTIFKRKEYRKSFLGILETIITVGGIGKNPQKKLREQIIRDLEAIRAGG